MKRLGNIAAAVAFSGVLVTAGAPLALASDGAVPTPTVTLGERGTNDEGGNGNGDNNNDEGGNRENNEGGNPYENNNNFRAECADGNNVKLNIKWENGEKADSFEYDGKTWFLHENGEDYVTDSANRGGQLTEEQKNEGQQAAAKKFGYTCDYSGDDSNRGENNDGGRNENNGGGENNNNGGGNNGGGDGGRETNTLGERGMNADTGTNTVARTLFVLAALSIFGAGAFAARRFLTA